LGVSVNKPIPQRSRLDLWRKDSALAVSSNPAVLEPENGVIETKDFRIEVKIVLGYIVMLSKSISVTGLVIDQGRSWNTFLGGADIAICGETGFDVTARAVTSVRGAAKEARGASPRIVGWELRGRCIRGIGN
jgi:hypothetical protein